MPICKLGIAGKRLLPLSFSPRVVYTKGIWDQVKIHGGLSGAHARKNYCAFERQGVTKKIYILFIKETRHLIYFFESGELV
jgi:hypothetical protein